MRFDQTATFIKKGKDILKKGKIVRDNIYEEYPVSERQIPFEQRYTVLGSLSENPVMLVVPFDVPHYDEVLYLGEKYKIQQIMKYKHKTGFVLGERIGE